MSGYGKRALSPILARIVAQNLVCAREVERNHAAIAAINFVAAIYAH
jgi:hypothetical protein